MATAADEQIVTPIEARLELSRVLASPDFVASRQLSNFLQFIVDESLAGRSDHIKERTVARGALERDTGFDPRLDCVVRVVAGKLRRSLDRYYSLQGAGDALQIEVPKGTYAPSFRRHLNGGEAQHSTASQNRLAIATAESPPRARIAVAPFGSLSVSAKERLLADLLADDIVVRLARYHEIDVIDCLAEQPARWRAEGLCKTAANLHADFILGGTVSRVALQFRLTVRLIDVQSGVLVWGEQYDRQFVSGQCQQLDEIADRIAANIVQPLAGRA